MQPMIENPPTVTLPGLIVTGERFEQQLHAGYQFVEAKLNADKKTLDVSWVDDAGTKDNPRRAKTVVLQNFKPTKMPPPGLACRQIGTWKNDDNEKVLLFQIMTG